MPKIVIPKETFSEIDIYTQKYNIRYRIITDNQNNISYWSPIFQVDPELIFWRGTIEAPGYMYLEKLGSSFVTATWDSVAIYKKIEGSLTNIQELESYDIWIKWAGNSGADPSDWIYKERVSSTSASINIPSAYVDSGGTTRSNIKYLYLEVYRPGRPISRYEQINEFLQSTTTVSVANNWIDFGEGNGLSTGTPTLYTSTTPIGGLTTATTYYIRTINHTTIALYATRQDSLDDANRINLTSTGSGTGSFTGFPFRMYDALVTSL